MFIPPSIRLRRPVFSTRSRRLRGLLGLLLLVSGNLAWGLGEPTPAPSPSPVDPAASRIELNEAERAWLAAQGPIKLAVDPDWEPYEWLDGDGVYRGIAADLLGLIAQRLGMAFELVPTANWEESIARSKSGEVQILGCLNETPARSEWLIFTEPYFEDPNVFITRQDHDFIADPARLAGERIAFPAGTSLEERVRVRYPALRVVTTESESEVFRLVQDGRADMTLRSLTMAAFTLRREGLFDLKIAGQYPEFANRFRIGVRKDLPELRAILDKGVRSIRPEDVQAAINHYVSIEAKTGIDHAFVLRLSAIFAAVIGLGAIFYFKLAGLYRRLRARERELTAQKDHLRLIIDTVPDYIYAKDLEGRFILANKACAEIFGCRPEEVVGKSNRDYGAEAEDMERIQAEDREVLGSGLPLVVELEPAPRRDGSPGWFRTTKLPYRRPDTGEPAVLGVSIDITEQLRKDEQIRHLASHDGLTDLPNRALFRELLEQAMAAARRQRSGLALLFIDLDGFKPINDSHGHEAGDVLLRATADRIRGTLRASDGAGRIGGDEFVVFLNGVTEAVDVRRVADKLAAAIGQPLLYREDSLQVSASVGFALFPEEAEDADALFRLADEAMYAVKRGGRG